MPSKKPTCPKCGETLAYGVAHRCAGQNSTSAFKIDWKWMIAFVLQTVLLLAGWMWKAGQLQQQLLDLQKQEESHNASSEARMNRLEGFFIRPPSQ